MRQLELDLDLDLDLVGRVSLAGIEVVVTSVRCVDWLASCPAMFVIGLQI